MKHDEIELRSEELQDIIGRIPTCFERYGILVIFMIVTILSVGSYFFYYPETLDATMVITNITPPANVVAKTSGNLERVIVVRNHSTKKGQVLAIIKSTAKYEDVVFVKTLLERWEKERLSLTALAQTVQGRDLNLGDIQKSYVQFCSQLQARCLYMRQDYYPKKIALTQKRQLGRLGMEKMEYERHALNEEMEKTSREVFVRDSILFREGVLSEEDYGKSRNVYLLTKQAPINREVEEQEHVLQRIVDKETMLDLKNLHTQNLNKYEQDFLSAVRLLSEMIKQWEQTYLLISPIEGNVDYVKAWGDNQYVASGEIVFVVTPKKRKQPIGKAMLQASGAGKVKKGQQVLVDVNNFPEADYGSLVGTVEDVSNVPTADGFYMVDVGFPKGLQTIYYKQLPTVQQLIGNARIVVKNRRLCNLFLQPINRLLEKQKVLANEK